MYEQEELAAQKSGLELYEVLSPMLSPEMKKNAKTLWVETADFRDAINSFTTELEGKELILQESRKEAALINGKTLDELSKESHPSSHAYVKKEPDNAIIQALFDDFYELLKNAFLIIIGVLIIGKVSGLCMKKIIKGRERRKKRNKRKVRRHSKRQRKKRRRSYALFKVVKL